MTDRGEAALRLSRDRFVVGPSHMHWTGSSLDITINEVTVPHCDRLKGVVRLHPEAVTDVEALLHPDGSHVWRPFAPTARIEVALERPGWHWSGHGYFDANFGTSALEDDFSYWTWARLPVDDGTHVYYDANRRDGSVLALSLKIDKDGTLHERTAPPKANLGRSLWAVRRETRADQGYRPRQVKAMLDAPFYTRSAILTKVHGKETVGVHEALDLDRFANPLLKPMLAVKVPRRANWRF